MKIKYRKQHPQPPKWAFYELDGCYFCKNRSNCGNCKVLKQFKILQRKREKLHTRLELKERY